MKVYRATIHIAVEADSEAEACDYISETMRGAVMDWEYTQENGDYTKPVEAVILRDYLEGDAFLTS